MLRHASIDILAGVACMYLFVIRILDVSLQLPILFTLVLSTWVIYTIDHILDAYKLRESIIKERRNILNNPENKEKYGNIRGKFVPEENVTYETSKENLE